MASENWLNQDFYKVLGVSEAASDADIKKAYRKLARKYHPDQHPGDQSAEKKFKEISEAYDVLSDPKDRKEYDQLRQYGAAGFAAGADGRQGFPGGFTGFSGPNLHFSAKSGGAGNINLEDLLGGMFSGSSSSSFSQSGFGGFSQPPAKGSDAQAKLSISFEDSFTGTTVSLTRPDGNQTSLRVPAGVRDGQKLKLRGKGFAGPGGPGDLIATVQVSRHPVFERDGDDLLVHLPVSLQEAMLGAVLQVPLPDGQSLKMRLKPGLPVGNKLRAKGKGFSSKKHTGNLLVIPEVQLPKDLSAQAREAFDRFVELAPQGDVRADLLKKAG